MTTFPLGQRKSLYREKYGNFEVDVYLLTDHRTIVYEMQGFPMSHFIEPYLTDLLTAARDERPIAMIADPRRMHVLPTDFQHAVQTRFWPSIATLGVKKNPAILSTPTSELDAISQSSVKRMVGKIGETVTTDSGHTLKIALLPSLEDCLRWIAADDDVVYRNT